MGKGYQLKKKIAGAVLSCVVIAALVLSSCGTTTITAIVTTTRTITTTTTTEVPTIEIRYAAAGKYAVSTMTATSINDDKGLTIFYPTNMETGKVYPLVTWGNGTYTGPSYYVKLLSSIASYGFVVVASNDSNVGTGTKMINAAQYILDQNGDPSSIFYKKIDVNNIASIGYSQGAAGAVNVATDASFGPKIKTVVCLSLVLPATNISLKAPCDVSKIGNKPTLLLSGEVETANLAPPAVTKAYYDVMVGAGSPCAMAILPQAGHLVTWDTGGNQRLWGYVNAWLMYQLQGDNIARGAFAGNNPEILTNTNWLNVATNKLP